MDLRLTFISSMIQAVWKSAWRLDIGRDDRKIKKVVLTKKIW